MRRAAAWILVLGFSLSFAAPSEACLRDMPKLAKKKVQVDPTKRDVIAAEKALAGGDHAKAARLAKGAVPGLSELPPVGAAELATRAQRTLALATVRSGGNIEVAPGIGGDDAYAKQVALAWAELTLTYQSAMKSDDVMVRSQLAEALAADDYQSDRAREMLRDLSARDLMPTARAYAVLAHL
ncbi:MAG: hypothetical protein IAG13_35515, partial [Deltaproteobacteria bacterium]|nr:hypothetical protein [Nannocystaceae bacterium]